MTWPDYGVHHELDFAVYRADDITPADTAQTAQGKAVSKSLVVSVGEDPGAWKATPKKAATKAMRAGSLLDCLLTTPHELGDRYAISTFSSMRSKDAQSWRDQMLDDGIEVITPEQMQMAQDQKRALFAHPCAARLLHGAQMQVAFRHRTRHGFDAKGLIDIIPQERGVLVDLKTCESGALDDVRSMQRHIAKWAYHVQAGAYCDGYSIASGVEVDRFKFIFVGKDAPYRVAVVELPMTAIMRGADIYQSGMTKFAECLATDRWPSIWDDEKMIDLPEYLYA